MKKFKNFYQTFIRSFFLQAYWNFAQMQNIGLLFIILPSLKRIYKGEKTLMRRALKRNMEVFNSHPVLSAYSVGAMIKQEEKIAVTPKQEMPEEERELRIIRISTANTAASIGDRLFWGTLKPLSLVFFIVALFAGDVDALKEGILKGEFLFPVVLALLGSLFVYNVPALVTRAKGLADSYNGTEEDFYGLINLNWNRVIYFLKTLGQIFTLFIIFYGLYIQFHDTAWDVDTITRLSLLPAFIILSIFMRKLNIPNIFLYIIATIVFGLASFAA